MTVPAHPPLPSPEQHLQLGRTCLRRAPRPTRPGCTLTCFMTTEPAPGLTFHVRVTYGRRRAGMVTVTPEALAQGPQAARDALAYLLHLTEHDLLPHLPETARTPLLGVWTAGGCALRDRHADRTRH